MKTRMFVLTIAVLSLSACVEDYYGSTDNSVELTESNYLYEGDLYTLFLDAELAATEARIAELEEIISNNQGNEQVEKELDQQLIRMDALIAEKDNIIDLDQVLIDRPKPSPPCPKPRNCDYTQFEYIVVSRTVKEISIRILDENNDQVGGGRIDDLMPLSNSQELLAFSTLSISPYNGPIKIEVTVIDETGQDRMYLVE